jgi:acetate kinase
LKILVLNSGSSSIKYQLFEITNTKQDVLFKGLVEEVKDYQNALDGIFTQLIKLNVIESFNQIDAFGHRVVHGGDKFYKPVVIDDEVISSMQKVSNFAPLHNKANLQGIEAIFKREPNSKQIAVFDTAFHQTMPKTSYLYPIPYQFYEKDKIRRYGFHGSSHHFVAKECSKYLDKPLEKLNLITVHLGNGASVCAIENGKSIDTSMGLTPLEGLMMGTRSGDIDPAIVFYLENELKIGMEEIENILNKQSGLLGVCGQSSDLRKILELANDSDERSKLALEMFAHRVKKYIGAYIFLLDRVDAIIFTGGIGENCTQMRDMIMQNKIDTTKNNQKQKGIMQIQSDKFDTKVLVIPTNEELEIANATYQLIV